MTRHNSYFDLNSQATFMFIANIPSIPQKICHVTNKKMPVEGIKADWIKIELFGGFPAEKFRKANHWDRGHG